ncbi:NAD(P)-binding protein [Guyanagaster necrorhizus]|uniref:NAD(P)-binding protein n=1 Tax=Guyanagaster necrorhizus TaxID=856835 RepID=A0A9P7VWT0_9AGAR|nr:NAD(P)-binding protein [Guyanagaster necrorhizus MCA 3950]KAG7447885.1 NAD(P)-binding protein [Guyanagaster necrorhizus MCA 3950]
MSHKHLVVFGATGQQGSSVVATFLKDKIYIVWAITRNPDSEKAEVLAASSAQIIMAELNDYKSILKKFEVHFWTPLPVDGLDEAFEREIQQSKNLANAAAATPILEHYVWSSLPSAAKGGVSVPHINSKAHIYEYIFSSLPALANKITVFWAGFYAENLGTFNHPVKLEEEGGSRILELWGEANGVGTVFIQKDVEEFSASCYTGPVVGRELALNMKYFEFAETWAKSGVVEVLRKEDLGIEDVELVSMKQAFERIDWSDILKA